MASWWERHGVPRLIKCACSQGQVMKLRSKVVPHARGHVLELGCGGGINMEFYRPGQIESFSGLDPSPELLAMSIAAAAARGRSEEHTSELQSLMRISYAVFCLKKKKTKIKT